MFSSLLDSERDLYALDTERDFVKGSFAQKSKCAKVKEIVMNDRFVDMLRKALKLLIPIDWLNIKYRSDKVPISDVGPEIHFLLITIASSK